MTTTAPAGDLSPGRRVGSWITVLFWCVLSILLVAFASGKVLTAVVVVPCALLAPGIVVVRLLRLRGVPLAVTVVLLVGIVAGVLVPSALLYVGAWSPRGAFAVIMAGTMLGASAGILTDAGISRSPLRSGAVLARGGPALFSAGRALWRRGLRAPPATPPEPPLVMPKRVTQAWIEENVPHMSATTLADFISELWKCDWTDSEIARRVLPHVRR
jgi:hypothetical protein